MSEISSQNSPEVFYEGRDLEALTALRRYREWIMAYFSPFLAGNTLEVGAGIGNMSKHLSPFVSTLDLVEPSSNLVGTLKTRFSHSDKISVTHETFEGFVSTKSAKSYDCIVMVNVLEHIEDDRAALKECYRILRPGGHLLILVPALQFLFSKLDEVVGHCRRYERPDLEYKIQECDFHLVELRFFDLVGVLPWWLLNTVGGATGFNPQLVSLYDALAVPVTRLIESAFTPPIGKNLIAVLRRPQ